MFETSKDILNIVLAVSVFGISFFICWSLFYFTMIIKNMFSVVKKLKDTIDKVDDAVKSFKDKVESTSSYLPLIGEGVKKLVDLMKDKYEGGSAKSESEK